MSTDSTRILRDKTFYCEVVFLQVANYIFSVPRGHLDIQGTTFSQMFIDGTPFISSNNIPEGSHYSNPIILHDTDINQFRHFMKAIWKQQTASDTTSEDYWMSVFSLATLWNFESLRCEAKDALYAMLNRNSRAIYLIKLGRQFEIKEWVVTGYVHLLDLDISFGMKHLIENGFESQVSDLFAMREAIRDYLFNWSGRTGRRCCASCGERSKCNGEKSKPCSCYVKRNDTIQTVTMRCKCESTVFLHRTGGGGRDDWKQVAEMMVMEIMKDHLLV